MVKVRLRKDRLALLLDCKKTFRIGDLWYPSYQAFHCFSALERKREREKAKASAEWANQINGLERTT